MNAIKAAQKLIESNPDDPEAKVLANLVLALEDESSFSLGDLYRLGEGRFELAIRILEEWRIDRYYAGKAKLFDLSWQVRDMRGGGAPTS